MLIHVFNLAGEDVGHCHLHRRRQIDDRFMLCIRLPDIQHCVTDLQRVINLGLGKAFGAVLEGEITFCLLGKCL